MKSKLFAAVTQLSALAAIGMFAASAHAGATATWSSFTSTTAVGELDGVSINVFSSATSPLVGFANNQFGAAGGPCGGWDGSMPLDHADEGVTASYVNKGDFQEFIFGSALNEGLFYIENFDANSLATITFTGATSVTLVDASASISYTATGASTGTLATSNMGYDGEGDAALLFTGDVTSVRIDYASGDGANGVFYTFAKPCPVPEPTSAMVMAGLFGLGGCFFYIRRKK